MLGDVIMLFLAESGIEAGMTTYASLDTIWVSKYKIWVDQNERDSLGVRIFKRSKNERVCTISIHDPEFFEKLLGIILTNPPDLPQDGISPTQEFANVQEDRDPSDR